MGRTFRAACLVGLGSQFGEVSAGGHSAWMDVATALDEAVAENPKLYEYGGVSFMVGNDKGPLVAREYGPLNSPAGDLCTGYTIMSGTKLTTAAAIGRAVAKGHLKFDEPISTYLSWSDPLPKPADRAATPWADVGKFTLAQFLNQVTSVSSENDCVDSGTADLETCAKTCSGAAIAANEGQMTYNECTFKVAQAAALAGVKKNGHEVADWFAFFKEYLADEIGLEYVAPVLPKGLSLPQTKGFWCKFPEGAPANAYSYCRGHPDNPAGGDGLMISPYGYSLFLQKFVSKAIDFSQDEVNRVDPNIGYYALGHWYHDSSVVSSFAMRDYRLDGELAHDSYGYYGFYPAYWPSKNLWMTIGVKRSDCHQKRYNWDVEQDTTSWISLQANVMTKIGPKLELALKGASVAMTKDEVCAVKSTSSVSWSASVHCRDCPDGAMKTPAELVQAGVLGVSWALDQVEGNQYTCSELADGNACSLNQPASDGWPQSAVDITRVSCPRSCGVCPVQYDSVKYTTKSTTISVTPTTASTASTTSKSNISTSTAPVVASGAVEKTLTLLASAVGLLAFFV